MDLSIFRKIIFYFPHNITFYTKSHIKDDRLQHLKERKKIESKAFFFHSTRCTNNNYCYRDISYVSEINFV